MTSIGIDFGGTSIKFGVVRGKEIIATAEPIIPRHHPVPADLIAAIADTCHQLIEQHPEVVAIGCGVPGFVNYQNGIIHNLTNVPGWVNINLKKELHQLTGLPIAVENDANAMAIAEWKLGAAIGYQHVVCITLGTGVGGGIIANGQIVRGANFGAGELGQTSIDHLGRMGKYNNPGALEAYLGNHAFATDAQAAYSDQGIIKTHEECSPKNLAIAAEEGCPIAQQAWLSYSHKLATALATTCWMLNPEIIVIGGGVAQAGAILFTPLKQHLNNQLSEPFKDQLKVVPAHFSNNAGILGCAALALETAAC